MELNKTQADWNLSSKIRIALKVHEETEDVQEDIKIGAADGVVYLKGQVSSEEARDAVDKIARGVPEMFTLVNEIEVVH